MKYVEVCVVGNVGLLLLLICLELAAGYFTILLRLCAQCVHHQDVRKLLLLRTLLHGEGHQCHCAITNALWRANCHVKALDPHSALMAHIGMVGIALPASDRIVVLPHGFATDIFWSLDVLEG